ncbi:MAG TPA: redox-regulated ATPase YchF [Vicinamibacterales bacterium]|nr:redox-regulated ATPase YchF [Vicinamibacterales bacterium]
MRTAIIGLPMTGKTSLFTILTGVHEPGRLGQLEARVGVARVPDPRLDALAKLFNPPKVTHATVEYLDFPSISKEALANASYLGALRNADSLAHVLRVFTDETVPHEKGTVDPVRDAEDVEMELILNDLGVVEKRMERVEKDRKKQKTAELDAEYAVLERCKAAIENNQPLRNLELTPDDEKRIRGFQFLSRKPMLYVLNVGEDDAVRLHEVEREFARGPLGKGAAKAFTGICGKVEAELAELSPADAKEFMANYGIHESGLERMIGSTYKLLGLMSFLTAGETEVRAWTVHTGSKAPVAAGAIHSDFEKKFIRAEVVNWQLLIEHHGYPALKEKGLLRLEGKEYVVKDGDVLVIRHG